MASENFPIATVKSLCFVYNLRYILQMIMPVLLKRGVPLMPQHPDTPDPPPPHAGTFDRQQAAIKDGCCFI